MGEALPLELRSFSGEGRHGPPTAEQRGVWEPESPTLTLLPAPVSGQASNQQREGRAAHRRGPERSEYGAHGTQTAGGHLDTSRELQTPVAFLS